MQNTPRNREGEESSCLSQERQQLGIYTINAKRKNPREKAASLLDLDHEDGDQFFERQLGKFFLELKLCLSIGKFSAFLPISSSLPSVANWSTFAIGNFHLNRQTSGTCLHARFFSGHKYGSHLRGFVMHDVMCSERGGAMPPAFPDMQN